MNRGVKHVEEEKEEEEEEDLDIEKEDCNIEEDDEYIDRDCAVDWDSLPIYDDYLDENKVIYIQGEPITHIVDETLYVQAQEVTDFIDYNHTLVQLVCSAVDEFSIDEPSFNLLKLELETLNTMISLGLMSFSQIGFDEIDHNIEDEMKNLFVGHRRRKEKPLVSYNSSRWEFQKLSTT